MSEGKEPVGFVNPKEIAWIDKGKGPKFVGVVSKEKTADKTFPLYTAKQLAEAAAAERERCAKVCEAHSNSALASAMIGGPDAQGLQNISRAHQRAAQSIRSTTE